MRQRASSTTWKQVLDADVLHTMWLVLLLGTDELVAIAAVA